MSIDALMNLKSHMSNLLQPSPACLLGLIPETAIFIMKPDHFLKVKGTVFCGELQCERLTVGDRILLVNNTNTAETIVHAMEQFGNLLISADYREKVAIMIRECPEFALAENTEIFLLKD